MNYNWQLDFNSGGKGLHPLDPIIGICKLIEMIFKDHYPEFNFERPFLNACIGKVVFRENWFAVRLESVQYTTGIHFGSFNQERVEFIESALSPFREYTHNDLLERLGPDWFSASVFTYVGLLKDEKASRDACSPHVIAWLTNICIPQIYEHNKRRIMHAIPQAPDFDIARIEKSCWVIESESHLVQGTAFDLAGFETVTCAHCLAPDLYMFRSNDLSKKFPVKVLSVNETIDLAIIETPAVTYSPLDVGSADTITLQSHLGIAGHPNYRFGDTVQFRPGIVTGFRPVSGIRRILTNAGIVVGNSGGPVIRNGSIVLGIAVTGAATTAQAETTEDQGIIPVEALKHLKSD